MILGRKRKDFSAEDTGAVAVGFFGKTNEKLRRTRESEALRSELESGERMAVDSILSARRASISR